jgi:hypothetical protein
VHLEGRSSDLTGHRPGTGPTPARMAMPDMLRYRGPNSRAFWRARRLLLAHTRPAIIDTTTAAEYAPGEDRLFGAAEAWEAMSLSSNLASAHVVCNGVVGSGASSAVVEGSAGADRRGEPSSWGDSGVSIR